MMQAIVPFAALAAGAILAAGAPGRSPERDAAEVAALDTAYQARWANDAVTMDRIWPRLRPRARHRHRAHKVELLEEARRRASPGRAAGDRRLAKVAWELRS